MKSKKSVRRSSFDILESESDIEKTEINNLNNSSKINPCYIKIILINTSIFLFLIFLIIFLKTPQENNNTDKPITFLIFFITSPLFLTILFDYTT